VLLAGCLVPAQGLHHRIRYQHQHWLDGSSTSDWLDGRWPPAWCIILSVLPQ
jgi:hypothetical protein